MKRSSTTPVLSTILLCCLAIVQVTTFGRFARPQLVPTDRLIENTEAYLKENPNDTKAYFTLARIHYLTFRNRAAMVQAYSKPNPKALSRITPDYHIHFDGVVEELMMAEAKKRAGEGAKYNLVREEFEKLKAEKWKPKQLSPEEALKHASESEACFDKAIEADPKNALYLLGKASLRDQIHSFKKEHNLSEGETDADIAKTIRVYHQAYELAIDEDLKREFMPVSGFRSMVGYESGAALTRMAEEFPKVAKTLSDIPFNKISKNTEKLKKLPIGAITPIVISMNGDVELANLVNQREVDFDIDGDGIKETISSWPKKETGILVWDSSESGDIRSGAQLFGTFGFRMLWQNGYEPLDALDDSRDGWLQGPELPGIRVWFDANENAISEPGEVRSLHELGISEIAVSPAESKDGILINRDGVRFENEKTGASVDWLFDVVK